jgi:hypothetical protein
VAVAAAAAARRLAGARRQRQPPADARWRAFVRSSASRLPDRARGAGALALDVGSEIFSTTLASVASSSVTTTGVVDAGHVVVRRGLTTQLPPPRRR